MRRVWRGRSWGARGSGKTDLIYRLDWWGNKGDISIFIYIFLDFISNSSYHFHIQ